MEHDEQLLRLLPPFTPHVLLLFSLPLCALFVPTQFVLPSSHFFLLCCLFTHLVLLICLPVLQVHHPVNPLFPATSSLVLMPGLCCCLPCSALLAEGLPLVPRPHQSPEPLPTLPVFNNHYYYYYFVFLFF